MIRTRMRAAILLAVSVLTVIVYPADGWVSQWFEAHRILLLNSTVVMATSAWVLVVFLAVSIAWLARRRRMKEATVVLCGTLLSLGIGSLIKIVVGRRRPYEALDDFESLVFASDASFPSNHTSGAFTACLLLAVYLPRARPVFFAFAALFAFTRLYVGVHYLSDICGGLALALLVSTILLVSVPVRPAEPEKLEPEVTPDTK